MTEVCSTEQVPSSLLGTYLLNANNRVKAILAETEKALVGQRVKIVSNYNGQPHGRSKPSQRGQEGEVECVHFDPHWGPSLKLKDRDLYLGLDEVEFL